MFEGSQHHDHGYFQPLQDAGALAERIDQRRSHQLLGGRALQRARAGAVDGVRSHGLPAAGADRGQVQQPARRRAERAAAELREPSLRARRDGDRRGALSARSSVSLAHDRRRRRPARRARSTMCARSFSATTIRRTRRSRLPATSIPTRRLRWRSEYFGDLPPGSDRGRHRSAAAPRLAETRLLFTKIGSSCRVSTWRGTRRRCSGPTMPSSISSPTCSPAARRRGCTERWSTSSASRPTSRPPELARARRLLPGRRRPPRRGTRSPSSSGRSPRRSRGSAPKGRRRRRWSAASRQAEAQFIFRLQTVGGFGGKSDQLNAYNVFLGDPGFFDRDLPAIATARPARCGRRDRCLTPSRRVALSVVPRGRADLALDRFGQPVSVS